MAPSDQADHLGICMYLRSTKINQILRYHARALAPAVTPPSKDDEPIDLFVDNKSAIDVAYNPEHHTRMMA